MHSETGAVSSYAPSMDTSAMTVNGSGSSMSSSNPSTDSHLCALLGRTPLFCYSIALVELEFRYLDDCPLMITWPWFFVRVHVCLFIADVRVCVHRCVTT
jgi:hypothetical protein